MRTLDEGDGIEEGFKVEVAAVRLQSRVMVNSIVLAPAKQGAAGIIYMGVKDESG